MTRQGDNDHAWAEYFEEFRPHITPGKVRRGCHPRKRIRRGATASVVLVHGLSDSPHYVSAIADYFHEELGYNTFQPLLHYHGLKKPGGMEGVELEEWKRNVRFAVDAAHRRTPGKVSVGGLSTGGALSFYWAVTSPRVTGDLFLFSAALELGVNGLGPINSIVQRLMRSRRLMEFLDERDEDKPLVGDNPFKYDYVDKDGARELARLIKENTGLLAEFDQKNPFARRVFAAHSHDDTTATINGIKDFQRRCMKGRFKSFYIPKKDEVSHGGLVLDEDVVGRSGKICTARNPLFGKMMSAVAEFVREDAT